MSSKFMKTSELSFIKYVEKIEKEFRVSHERTKMYFYYAIGMCEGLEKSR